MLQELNSIQTIQSQATAIALVALRLSPIMLIAPVANLNKVPILARLVIVITLSIAISSELPSYQHIPENKLAFTVARELMSGICLAFSIHATISAASSMGYILDQQIGLSAATILDPTTNNATSIISELLTISSALLFITSDSHHDLLITLRNLIEATPQNESIIFNKNLINTLSIQFALAITMTAPIMVGLWLVDIIIAMSSKMAPQANIYFLSIPIKILIGITAFSWLSKNIAGHIINMFSTAIRNN